MPVDGYEGDDDDRKGEPGGTKSTFKEFDCPGCSANNPCDPPFGDGDEVLCNYCGTEYKVKVNDEGRAKFKET
jgi:hypothetical protein